MISAFVILNVIHWNAQVEYTANSHFGLACRIKYPKVTDIKIGLAFYYASPFTYKYFSNSLYISLMVFS